MSCFVQRIIRSSRVARCVSCRVIRDTTYAGLLLAHHDGVPQVEVDDGDHFVLGRLEEGVLDVLEHDVHVAALGRAEAETVLVELQRTRRTPSAERRAYVQIGQRERTTYY